VAAEPDPYVSRAAHKLAGALDELGLVVAGRALDAGAATGGFSQVLLERGCTEVIAVDVGAGQLHDRLRRDRRVTVWERTNLRELSLAHVGGRPVDLVVADVSFISLSKLVGPFSSVLRPDGRMLLMIKPQFEVGRDRLGRGGVVREPELQRAAIRQVLAAAQRHGWFATRVVASRRPGVAGNREFFALLRSTPSESDPDLDVAVAG
jgi:23S rRNA (cytidine1920-2'-O)/16S rRNA (cytidine1409-2'-O)-methyltransferase